MVFLELPIEVFQNKEAEILGDEEKAGRTLSKLTIRADLISHVYDNKKGRCVIVLYNGVSIATTLSYPELVKKWKNAIGPVQTSLKKVYWGKYANN